MRLSSTKIDIPPACKYYTFEADNGKKGVRWKDYNTMLTQAQEAMNNGIYTNLE